MLTNFMLLQKMIYQNKWKVIFIISFPLLLFAIIFPFLAKTVEASKIPVAIVNGENTPFVQTISSRLEDHPRMKIIHMDTDDANIAVRKGEVEAVFTFDEHFEENIKGGDINDQITWKRTENSFLDSFIKEKIASEVMRLALNSRAANDIAMLKQENEEDKWQQSFEHVESYWEPEALFQMKFIPFTPQLQAQQEENVLDKTTIGFLGFWFLYCWIIFAISHVVLYNWKQKGILERIMLTRGTLLPFYCIFYVSTILFSIILFIGINGVTANYIGDYNKMVMTKLPLLTAIVLFVFILTSFIHHLFKRRNHFLLFVTVYSMSSFALSVFVILSDELSWWYYLLPHVWLYEVVI